MPNFVTKVLYEVPRGEPLIHAELDEQLDAFKVSLVYLEVCRVVFENGPDFGFRTAAEENLRARTSFSHTKQFFYQSQALNIVYLIETVDDYIDSPSTVE